MDAEAMDELRRRAEAATPGPWRADPMGFNVAENGLIIETIGAEVHPAAPYAEVVRVGVVGKPRTARELWADARYIAAANPATLLSLIAHAERQQAAIDAARTALIGIVEADARIMDAVGAALRALEATITLQENV